MTPDVAANATDNTTPTPKKPSFAATRPVNPPGVTPILTHEQVWKGLAYKARYPKAFMPVITSCELVEDHGDKVVRSVRFGDAEPVDEYIDLYEPTIIYFEIPSRGNRITNFLSYDVNDNLLLTFTFANGIPGGSLKDSVQESNKMIGGGVERTINKLREMVKAGEL
ncbi:DUF1857-domain-containing protein [Pluteus cervinus]|uniref:DUF1857-domain-containing protein n=1 Tax=Pluteus cervinus TaxID=181527 RepID=A0ACD3AYX2_9AGAR|nr:DUF1857-domain-containing protein [Pluteus cervinus]